MTRSLAWRRGLVGLGIAWLVLLAGACEPQVLDPGGSGGPGAEPALVPIRITAVTVGTPISTLVVEVTATDIPTQLVFNLTVANQVATGTIRIPHGLARTIRVTAVDDGGNVTHEGSATIDVRPGQNPPLDIRLAPRSGHLPITVTLGNYGVVVTPASATIDAVALKTLQLAVTVTDVNGQVLQVPAVGWATTNPAIATVTATGLVTGIANGAVTIVATYEGVAGLSAVTVTGAGSPNPGSAEVCDGLDNDLDGQPDNGLRYCINGQPAPNTDGQSTCNAGYVDSNGDASDGCERLINGVWTLQSPISVSCAGLPQAAISTADFLILARSATRLEFFPSVFLFGNALTNSAAIPVELVPVSETFSGTATSGFQQYNNSFAPAYGSLTVSINGVFTGASTFVANLAVKLDLTLTIGGIDFHQNCPDVNVSVIGRRAGT